MIRLVAALLLLFVAAPAEARQGGHWIGGWATSVYAPEERNTLPVADLADATLRQVVRVTLGGARLRVRLSNSAGTQPLRIGAAHVALSADPASARIGRGTALTFSGQAEIVIPAGADYVSDPVPLPVAANGHLTISLYLPEAPARQTGHPGSRATSYLARGNRVAAPDLPGAQTVNRWYQLAGVDVEAPAHAAAIVTFGDSITDGYGVQPNTDRRWPDYLARRLQADPATRHLAVLNQGIGGNRILLDGAGPNALARFERDVLSQEGVRFLVILEGVNDLGTATRDGPISAEAHRALVRNMIAAYAQMVQRARARGIKVIGATIIPFFGSSYYHPDGGNEADRQALNAWLRAPGNVDAVLDFDAALRDPADPRRMLPAMDSGDGLHPSLAGYEAMANAVPLSLFAAPALAAPVDPVQQRR
ncbi:MAG TPA: SGNH/GDSL hydrolase family protein [Allosphingosinicella sp.]|nr:SGNH/GDSL hydrolase family protein [Allosphingosinicella sp.]